MKKRLAAAFLALLAACGAPEDAAKSAPPFHAEEIQAHYGEGFQMTDTQGQTRILADWRGKVVLVFFGYTHCPDACPSALYRFSQVMEILGQEATQVQVLFITLDPARDTPEVLRNYAPAFNPSFLGLYVRPERTPEMAHAFHVFYRITPGETPDRYSVDHSVSAYAYDPSGRLRLEIPHTATPDEVADDVRQLLLENVKK
ncbi:MAG: SCO family protein [Zoogloeaceae bacterium]|jgi:protein SCO1/2|nr:SCO family protein [Zoogloeaceae bacterium]